jgi:hypothetical protein
MIHPVVVLLFPILFSGYLQLVVSLKTGNVKAYMKRKKVERGGNNFDLKILLAIYKHGWRFLPQNPLSFSVLLIRGQS